MYAYTWTILPFPRFILGKGQLYFRRGSPVWDLKLRRDTESALFIAANND